jgi:hypothetical protein
MLQVLGPMINNKKRSVSENRMGYQPLEEPCCTEGENESQESLINDSYSSHWCHHSGQHSVIDSRASVPNSLPNPT